MNLGQFPLTPLLPLERGLTPPASVAGASLLTAAHRQLFDWAWRGSRLRAHLEARISNPGEALGLFAQPAGELDQTLAMIAISDAIVREVRAGKPLFQAGDEIMGSLFYEHCRARLSPDEGG